MLEKFVYFFLRGDCGGVCLFCFGFEVDRSIFFKNYCVSEIYVICVIGSRFIIISNISMVYSVNE